MRVATEEVWRRAFAVRIVLCAPTHHSSAGLVKPLLDGLIAAFGAYDGARLTVAAETLAAQLGRDAELVAELLTARSHAVLGCCALVVVRATGVQWQPADDRCVACDLRIAAGASVGKLTGKLTGDLLAVSER